MHAYVINLARSLERRAHITAELERAGLEYEIVTGVDGRDLDLTDRATIDPVLFSRSSFPMGMAGCALSHMRIYRKVIEDGLDAALVLEDDVALPTGLGRLIDALAGYLAGAEVALLNYDSKDICKMSLEGALDLPLSRLLALPVDVRQPGSSAAYIITQEACRRMTENILPVRASPDDWWFFYREGVLDRVRCVAPLPVTKSPKFGSTIGHYSLGNGLKARLAAPILRRNVPLLRQVTCYRRQRIFRKLTRLQLTDQPFIEKPSRLG